MHSSWVRTEVCSFLIISFWFSNLNDFTLSFLLFGFCSYQCCLFVLFALFFLLKSSFFTFLDNFNLVELVVQSMLACLSEDVLHFVVTRVRFHILVQFEIATLDLLFFARLQKRVPKVGLFERLRVSNHHEKMSRSCDCNVKSAGVSQESKRFERTLKIIRPNTVENNDILFATLESINCIHFDFPMLWANLSQPRP